MFGKRRNPDPFIAPAFHDEFAAAPVTLLDVGARGGIQDKWRCLQPHLRVAAFEPDAEEFANLSAKPEPGLTYFNTALGGRPEKRTLNLTRSPGSTSVYRPNRAFLGRFCDKDRFDILDEITVDLRPLDDLLADHPEFEPDFMKLDVQGFECEVIKGAEKTLSRHLLGVEAEVEFNQVYEGQPLFRDVDAAITGMGFELFDLRPYYWKREKGLNALQRRGQAAFGDALYLKSPEADFSAVAGWGRGKMLRLAAVYLVFGYCDCALTLLHRFKDLLTPEQAAAAVGLAGEYARLAAANNRLVSHRLHQLFSRLACRTATDLRTPWSMGRTLGNSR